MAMKARHGPTPSSFLVPRYLNLFHTNQHNSVKYQKRKKIVYEKREGERERVTFEDCRGVLLLREGMRRSWELETRLVV